MKIGKPYQGPGAGLNEALKLESFIGKLFYPCNSSDKHDISLGNGSDDGRNGPG
jgi:hypothetical protein